MVCLGMDEKENYIPMDTNELNERPPKTPALNELYSGNKSALVKSNTRYFTDPILFYIYLLDNKCLIIIIATTY